MIHQENTMQKKLVLNALKQFTGMPVSGIVCNPVTGSAVLLNFGPIKKIRSNIRPGYTFDESEYTIFLTGCDWRLVLKHKIKTSCASPPDRKGLIFRQLKALMKSKVNSITLDKQSGDLQLHFSNAYRIDVFCVATLKSGLNDNYVIYLPQYTISYDNDGIFRKQTRIKRRIIRKK